MLFYCRKGNLQFIFIPMVLKIFYGFEKVLSYRKPSAQLKVQTTRFWWFCHLKIFCDWLFYVDIFQHEVVSEKGETTEKGEKVTDEARRRPRRPRYYRGGYRNRQAPAAYQEASEVEEHQQVQEARGDGNEVAGRLGY